MLVNYELFQYKMSAAYPALHNFNEPLDAASRFLGYTSVPGDATAIDNYPYGEEVSVFGPSLRSDVLAPQSQVVVNIWYHGSAINADDTDPRLNDHKNTALWAPMGNNALVHAPMRGMLLLKVDMDQGPSHRDVVDSRHNISNVRVISVMNGVPKSTRLSYFGCAANAANTNDPLRDTAGVAIIQGGITTYNTGPYIIRAGQHVYLNPCPYVHIDPVTGHKTPNFRVLGHENATSQPTAYFPSTIPMNHNDIFTFVEFIRLKLTKWMRKNYYNNTNRLTKQDLVNAVRGKELQIDDTIPGFRLAILMGCQIYIHQCMKEAKQNPSMIDKVTDAAQMYFHMTLLEIKVQANVLLQYEHALNEDTDTPTEDQQFMERDAGVKYIVQEPEDNDPFDYNKPSVPVAVKELQIIHNDFVNQAQVHTLNSIQSFFLDTMISFTKAYNAALFAQEAWFKAFYVGVAFLDCESRAQLDILSGL